MKLSGSRNEPGARLCSIGEEQVSTAEPEVAGRLLRALEAFRKALLLAAHRKLKGRSPKDGEWFWEMPEGSIEEHVSATAAEVNAAFKAFSAAGLIASAVDRDFVTEAQRHLAEGGP